MKSLCALYSDKIIEFNLNCEKIFVENALVLHDIDTYYRL